MGLRYLDVLIDSLTVPSYFSFFFVSILVYTNIFSGSFSFTQPHARTFASSSMISQDELLLFGGCLSGKFAGGPCPSSDSWLFSYINRNWERVESACIAPRIYSAMASILSDGYRKSAVMFSGMTKDNTIIAVIKYNMLLFFNIRIYWKNLLPIK